jgi:hypothetical protein
MAVLDTGTGPNLIREYLLPKNWEVYRIPGLALPRITNDSGRRISARGLVHLHVQVGGLVRRVRFYVTPGLAVPCILGCNFINLHVKAILPKEQKVLLQEGGKFPFRLAPGRRNLVRPSVPEVTAPITVQAKVGQAYPDTPSLGGTCHCDFLEKRPMFPAKLRAYS